MREDVKMSRCERRKCEDEKMFRRCEDEKMFYRPPLLEEPCAQTLLGKRKRSSPKRKRRRKGKALAPARRRVSPQVFNWPQPGGASCGGPLKRNPGG